MILYPKKLPLILCATVALSFNNIALGEAPFIEAIDSTDQFTASAINTFNSCLTLYKTCRAKQMYVWESIDALAKCSLTNNENEYWLSLEIARNLNLIVVAHGLAKKFIQQYAKNSSTQDFSALIQSFSPPAQDLLRKEFFLMTGNPEVMTYTDALGHVHTPTFVYQELFFERQYLIDNAKMCFSNRFLRSIDGITSPIIYYVDRIDLSHNFLTTLPDSLATVSTTKILDLSYNQFSTFPMIICKLPNLEILSLNNNLLTTLPTTLVELKQLYRVDARNNLLTEIPSVLFDCPNLHALDLAHNKLTKLPTTIPLHCKLEKLNVSSNQLSEIPIAFAQLTTLRILNIRNNPSIRTLPAAFKRIPLLEKDAHVVFTVE